MRTRSGLTIRIPPELVFTYKECFLDVTYLKGLPKGVHLAAEAVVVDIGANAGYFSLFMQERFPGIKIHSYEPMPANYALLRTYHGQFSRLNWRIFNKAVSGAEGALTLHDEEAEGYTTAASVFRSDGQGETIEVEAITLDQVFENIGRRQIDFLKLDCEGAEYSIIYNTSKEVLSKIKYIAIETHRGGEPAETRDSLEDYLQENGFQTWVKRSKIWAVNMSFD